MGKKGGGSTQTTTTKADPWVGVQPNLLDLYGNAAGWFNRPDATTAGSNYDINHSIDLTRQLADSGMPAGMNQARWTAENTANGQYAFSNPVQTGKMLTDNPWAMGDALRNGDNKFAAGAFVDDNPYLSGMVQAASRDVNNNFMNDIAPALASQFSAAGRTGSGAHVNAFGQAAGQLAGRLGDISSNIRGQAYEADMGRMSQAYEAERQRQYGAFADERTGQRNMWMQQPGLQLQAAGMMPSIAGSQQQFQLTSAQALQNSGLLQRQIQQEGMDDQAKRLQIYNTILQGASGYGTQSGSQSAQQPYNRLTGTVGGGLMGGMLGNAIGGAAYGPMGAAAGAIMGLFG